MVGRARRRRRRRGLVPFPRLPNPVSLPRPPSAPPSPRPPPLSTCGAAVFLPGFKSKLLRGGVWGREAEGEGMSRRGGVLVSKNTFFFFFSARSSQSSAPNTLRALRSAPGAESSAAARRGRAPWSGPCPARVKPSLPGPSAAPRRAAAGWAPQPRVSACLQVARHFVIVAFKKICSHVY